MTLEWTGVTVGYQGRYFETRNKPKGGAFADNGFMQEPLAFAVGDKTVIPAIDEAVRGMAPGGIRRIIVPEEIGYPKVSQSVSHYHTPSRELTAHTLTLTSHGGYL